jgi:cytidylate kinase
MQRDFARKYAKVVTEGRDQGTVVFPDAQVKFFLTASPGTPRRRVASCGPALTLMWRRFSRKSRATERRESSCRAAPPPPMIPVDTKGLSISVVDRLYQLVLDTGTLQVRVADVPSASVESVSPSNRDDNAGKMPDTCSP